MKARAGDTDPSPSPGTTIFLFRVFPDPSPFVKVYSFCECLLPGHEADCSKASNLPIRVLVPNWASQLTSAGSNLGSRTQGLIRPCAFRRTFGSRSVECTSGLAVGGESGKWVSQEADNIEQSECALPSINLAAHGLPRDKDRLVGWPTNLESSSD
jgi:hypothetical protein